MRIKPNFINSSINKIEKLYKEEGFFLAEVDAIISAERKNTQRNNITFTINEGKKK